MWAVAWLARLANTDYVSLFQQGNSLAYEWKLLPRYISKQRLHRCLARDREAGESDRAKLCMFYCPFNYTCYVGTERSDWRGFMHKTRFSPFKPYLQLRQTLLSNIYAVEMHPWQKCYCSWSENWRIHLSQKRKLPLRPQFFLLATSELCQMHSTNLCIDLNTEIKTELCNLNCVHSTVWADIAL